MITPLTKAQYVAHLADLNDPDLNNVWSIIEECYYAQQRKLTEVDFTKAGNSPQIVPLKVVTYLTGKYQWSMTTDNLPNQMRRINKITLI